MALASEQGYEPCRGRPRLVGGNAVTARKTGALSKAERLAAARSARDEADRVLDEAHRAWAEGSRK